MIQIDELHIEEFRGIRELTLELNRHSFAIQGPNGSGKSCVVDAAEFGLTGDVARLTGPGTQGLTVKQHGPHVDVRETPESAFVRLKVYLPKLNKTATITRTVKNPKTPTIEPPEPDIVAALDEVAQHPEIALSRRQIIKFILIEAGHRAKQVQTLLRLEQIETTRAVLKKSLNSAKRGAEAAITATNSASEALRRHLETEKLTTAAILAAANSRRQKLGLPQLEELSSDTSLKNGLDDRPTDGSIVSKPTALADLEALNKAIETTSVQASVDAILEQLALLDADPELNVALRRHQLIESGLSLLDSDECPLCDTAWDQDELRAHLLRKLELSKKAENIANKIKDNGREIAAAVRSHIELIRTAESHASRLKLADVVSKLSGWIGTLEALIEQLKSVEGISASRDKLATWQSPTSSVAESIEELKSAIFQLPGDASAGDRDFLVVASQRLDDVRRRKREAKAAKAVTQLASTAYESFCSATETVLESLYAEVERSFTESYRAINSDDEGEFTAKLTPADGKLELDVDFHRRGLFHPGAYHSEGHQDGMGLCLYLALMKQLFGDNFRLVILDDVVMSVDRQHRKQLCALLKQAFPDTQFVITTHDEAWFHQLRSAKLITRKYGRAFRAWSVESGPLVNEATDAWEDIEEALKADDVSRAAARLRRHLESISVDLADGLRADVPYRADGDHDLGDMLPNAIRRFRELLGKAATAAQTWKDDEAAARVKLLKVQVKEASARTNVEQWAVNTAVHYNAWADFVKEDFEPVVNAFHSLLQCFRCPSCNSWLYASPKKGLQEALRCDCGKTNFNLKQPE